MLPVRGETVSLEIEINELDLRYEKKRMRSLPKERQLMTSIMEVGITEALWGVVMLSGEKILLDGFKRVRCARKIGLHVVPFESLGSDEPTGIIAMLRAANRSAISLLEQAVFVEELGKTHGLNVSEIALRLQKSKSWVRVRMQALTEMSEATRLAILEGSFPLYSYLYTLHPYRRLPGVASKSDVDEFVKIVSGKGLSAREIERLANAYFRGGDEMRAQLRKGDLGWCLDEMRKREDAAKSSELTESENRIVRDLEIVSGVMGRLGIKLHGQEVKKPAFKARVDLLADRVLSQLNPFTNSLKDFYDRCRKA